MNLENAFLATVYFSFLYSSSHAIVPRIPIPQAGTKKKKKHPTMRFRPFRFSAFSSPISAVSVSRPAPVASFLRTQTQHSARRWNSSSTANSKNASWTTARALILAAIVGAGAYAAASQRGPARSTPTATTVAAGKPKAPRYGDITQFEQVL